MPRFNFKPKIRLRLKNTEPVRFDGHFCSLKGCGRAFRTKLELMFHEIKDTHCGKCGFGNWDPLGVLDKFKLCEACAFELDPAYIGETKKGGKRYAH